MLFFWDSESTINEYFSRYISAPRVFRSSTFRPNAPYDSDRQLYIQRQPQILYYVLAFPTPFSSQFIFFINKSDNFFTKLQAPSRARGIHYSKCPSIQRSNLTGIKLPNYAGEMSIIRSHLPFFLYYTRNDIFNFILGADLSQSNYTTS